MRRRVSTALLFFLLSVFLFASLSLYNSSHIPTDIQFPSVDLTPKVTEYSSSSSSFIKQNLGYRTRHVSSIQDSSVTIKSVSVLLPDWEVLVIVPAENTAPLLADSISGENFSCLYPNNATSPARFSGILPSTNQKTFKCILPRNNRRRLPFLSPVLIRSSEKEFPVPRLAEPMLRWSFLAYESFSTENDVVVFAKGVNNRQGINRPPHELRCVFVDETNNSNVVRTAVTSSVQEVFRCERPDITALGYGGHEEENKRIRISLEIGQEKGDSMQVPSAAYYTLWRRLANPKPKPQLCACTMVYDVAKFLREWVMYHSKIGVEKFLLYDNDSGDDLMRVIKELNGEGYNVETLFWIWPKTQEAGFSHAALYAKDSCEWMMYVDVDEFVFAPSWADSLQPSRFMLKSLIPRTQLSPSSIGQVSIGCNEFGPSNQKEHPVEGVTQGYNCRRKVENRHKSIVLLDAIDHSLDNAIHHFKLNQEKYRWKRVDSEIAVVNHYKYQAWSEFKTKFRRRVSAYVVDWRQAVNPLSKDRAPGLGFEAIEPPGWEQKFCEVRDDRLKLIARRWFGRPTVSGYEMAWQL